MTIARTVTDGLREHVTLELESIDRMYLNLYVPLLQTPAGVAYYIHEQLDSPMASTVLLAPKGTEFVARIERFAREQGVDLVPFRKGQRKDEVTQSYLATHDGHEGVLYIGKAQEKTRVVRTERRKNPETGQTYPWLYDGAAMVNHYYFYCVDKEFGPFFLKMCSYFPYNGKLCINGHEYLKRQLAKEGIEYEALDNGLLSCAAPARAQQIADGLSAESIDALARKWLRRLPHPFAARERQAGFRYEISILQAEFALTQVLDRPLTGRIIIEDIIRENIDMGRPDHVQLIFERRVTKRTPGRFRTRVITNGVIPSIHFDYKNSRIKQYFKEGRALRTETVVNNTYDFGIGKRLHNLPAVRDVGFRANRRLLDAEMISHDCAIGEALFQSMQQPIEVNGQRAPALRFGDLRVQTVFAGLVVLMCLPGGFSNRGLRQTLDSLLPPGGSMTPGKMTYDLRRLRLHGLIERIPRTYCYQLTELGRRLATFYSRLYARSLRPGLAQIREEVASLAHTDLCGVDV